MVEKSGYVIPGVYYNEAIEFVNKVLFSADVTKKNHTLADHFLGGIFTQQVGASIEIKAYAYNLLGSDALVKYPPNGILNVSFDY